MRRKVLVWTVAILAICVVCGGIFVSAQPGDNSDPIVTKSYVDQEISEVKSYVDQKTEGLSGAGSNTQTPSASGVSASYQVLNVTKGQKMTLGEGTEFILRAGKAEIFSTERGGIADTTAGVDLENGTSVPSNHLLIVPRADGRGFVAETDVIVMVRGSYQAK